MTTISSSKCTAPRNLDDITNKQSCGESCKYTHTYAACNCSVECPSGGKYLILCKNSSCSNQVSLGGKAYTLKSVRIYTPSLHVFSGQKADAEIVLLHQRSGGEYFLVCVPVKKGDPATNWFDFLKSMGSWQCTGKQTINTTGNWSLENILPDQKTTKYYYYDADSLPFGKKICQDLQSEINVVHYIIYNTDDATTISSNNLNILNKILIGHGIATVAGNQPVLSYTPSSIVNPDEYYWECAVADDNEETPTITSSQERDDIIMWVLLTIIILGVGVLLYKYGLSNLAKGAGSALGGGVAWAGTAATHGARSMGKVFSKKKKGTKV